MYGKNKVKRIKVAFLSLITTSILCVLFQPLENRPIRLQQWLRYNWPNLSHEQTENLSALGRRLFLGDVTAGMKNYIINKDKTFTILIWKKGPRLERRLLRHYTDELHSPWEGCSVSNCRLSYKDSDLPLADAVIFHAHQNTGTWKLPKAPHPYDQLWIFLTDETPIHTTMYPEYNNVFNWTMTYRMSSDIPVPYGRTLVLNDLEKSVINEENFFTKNKNFAAIMISNCGGKSGRMSYIKELKKYIPVDVYGRCGTIRCENHSDTDCPLLTGYKFYLAFENSNCREYITEKTWWNAYHKGSIPVIMGAPLEDCHHLLPPNSFLHVDNFTSPAELAQYLLHLQKSPEEYNSFFSWKKNFKVVNEHGYFQSPVYHYCRVCEALNYNDKDYKVIESVKNVWNVKRDCVKEYSSDKQATVIPVPL